MANYKSFHHVLKVDKPDVEGVLHGTLDVLVKIDGSNGEMFAKNGKVCYGSRKREVTCEDDNANFANYMSNSADSEVAALRQYVLDHPNYIVYGEWLGGVNGMKFTGSLKGYTEGGFIVFAVFDIESGRYLRYDEWHDDIAAIYHLVVPRIPEQDVRARIAPEDVVAVSTADNQLAVQLRLLRQVESLCGHREACARGFP